MALAAAALGGVLASIALWPQRPGDGEPTTEAMAAPPAKRTGVRFEGRVVDDRGEPVALARVSAHEPEAARDAPPAEQVESDAEGRFRFLTLAAGLYRLDASADHHAPAALPEVRAPSTHATLVLERIAQLKGRVLDAQGAAAAAVQVSLAGSGLWPPQTVESGADGGFALSSLPGGVYELRARKRAYYAEPIEGLAIEPGSTAEVTLTLVLGASLEGRVFDAQDGSPIADADVSVAEDALSALPLSTATDAEGHFAVAGLRPRPQRVSIEARGYVSLLGEPKTPTSEPLSFPLERAATLSGRVLDDGGRPVTGAELEVVGTGDKGEPLRLLAPAGPARQPAAFTIASSADNLGVTQGAVPKVPLQPSDAPSSLKAQLAMPGFVRIARPQSGPEGRFVITGIPAGKLQILARHPDFAPSRSEVFELHAGEERRDVTLTLSRGGRIAGRVVDPRGFPIAQVRLDLQPRDEAWPRTTVSDSHGEFRFEAVRGPCSLTAHARGLPPRKREIEVDRDAVVEVEIRLETEAFDLKGRVLDARGFGVSGVLVRVDSLDPKASMSLTTLSDDGGEFALSGLPAPPYRVAAEREGYAPLELHAVSPSAREAVVLTLRRGTTLEGTVRDAFHDSALEGAQLWLERKPKSERSGTRSDPSGSFAFRNLAPGDYRLLAEKAGFVPAETSVTVAASDDRSQSLDALRLHAAGAISGEIVDRRGVPVFDAEITIGAPADWGRAARSDHAGRFRLDALLPGEHVLSARHRSAGEVQRLDAVRVRPLEESPGVVLRLPGVAPAIPDAPSTARSEREIDLASDDAERPDAAAVSTADGSPVTFDYAAGAVRVTGVRPQSSAYRSGLRSGDILLTVDGESVWAAAQARAMLRSPPGKTALLVVQRDGKRKRLRVPRED